MSGASNRDSLGMSFRLEPLQDRWVEPVKALIAEVVLEFYAGNPHLPQSLPELLKHYERVGFFRDLDEHSNIYTPKNGVFLVLRQDEEVVGCGGLRRLNARDGELVRLWLKKEKRKQGLGLKLVENLMLVAEAIGYAKIFLDTSSQCTDAITLFKKKGFVECSPYKESIGDVFMCHERESKNQ